MKSEINFNFRNAILIIAMAIMGSLFLGISPVKAAEDTLTSRNIIAELENEYVFDPVVYSRQIDIQYQDGTATLNGTADTLLAKERAEQIAERIRGIRMVKNNITVVPPTGRNDIQIKKDIKTILLENPATSNRGIHVAVKDHVVGLKGKADSMLEKQLYENAAKSVKGVIAVNNGIQVIEKKNRSDFAIRSEIRKSLASSIFADDRLIRIYVSDGHVKLSGAVGGIEEKAQVIRLAHTAGVKSVDATQLNVARWARGDNENLPMEKFMDSQDEDIRKAVEIAMVFDDRVNSLMVRPDVENGMVTLVGTVDNLNAKRTAVQIAKSIAGVTSVKNQLKITSKIS